jgi:membrane protease YdiL (CAAX protease family)
MQTDQTRARRGLLVFFSLVVLLTGAIDVLAIDNREFDSLVLLTMLVPAFSATVARLVLREGFGDVSFRLGGHPALRWIVLAPVFAIVVCTVAYGVGWTTGLVHFVSQPADQLAANLALSTLISFVLVSGEEIGWRGYMLTRLVDAGVPRPILASGFIWGMWHVPLVLTGLYVAGPSPLVSAVNVVIATTAFGFIVAHARLSTGSVWPAVALHLAWNRIINNVFDSVTTANADTSLWVGESGVLTTVAVVVVVAISLRWLVRGDYSSRAAREGVTTWPTSESQDIVAPAS